MSAMAELEAKSDELIIKNNTLQQRYNGFLHLYNAACMEGHHEEMDRQRQAVLTTMEAILDNNASQFRLTNEKIKLTRKQNPQA